MNAPNLHEILLCSGCSPLILFDLFAQLRNVVFLHWLHHSRFLCWCIIKLNVVIWQLCLKNFLSRCFFHAFLPLACRFMLSFSRHSFPWFCRALPFWVCSFSVGRIFCVYLESLPVLAERTVAALFRDLQAGSCPFPPEL